jgi:hypothetical protein
MNNPHHQIVVICLMGQKIIDYVWECEDSRKEFGYSFCALGA